MIKIPGLSRRQQEIALLLHVARETGQTNLVMRLWGAEAAMVQTLQIAHELDQVTDCDLAKSLLDQYR